MKFEYVVLRTIACPLCNREFKAELTFGRPSAVKCPNPGCEHTFLATEGYRPGDRLPVNEVEMRDEVPDPPARDNVNSPLCECGHIYWEHDTKVAGPKPCRVERCACIEFNTDLDAKELPRTDDPVDHPKHYNKHPTGVECIAIVEHLTFNVGNAIKYLWRADHKNGLEDLRKAAWYVAREIARLEQMKNAKE